MPATICLVTSPTATWSSISLSAFGCGRASSTLATRSSTLAKSSYVIGTAIVIPSVKRIEHHRRVAPPSLAFIRRNARPQQLADARLQAGEEFGPVDAVLPDDDLLPDVALPEE